MMRSPAMAALLAALLALAPMVGASWPMGGVAQQQRLRCDGADAERESCTTRVTVVGAGIAGLTTARALQDLWGSAATSLSFPGMAGIEPPGGRGALNVTVIEARDTVGGRIYTKREDGSGPTEGDELGAMWIHDGDDATNPVLQIAELMSLQLEDVDLLSMDTVQPLRACSGAASSVPCAEVDAGDPTRNDYTASRRCIHMLLEAAQNSLGSSSAGNAQSADPVVSLQDAIDVVKGFANRAGVNPADQLTVTDGFARERACAQAVEEDPQFAALLEHHIAADVEHSFGASAAELDAKWYNYRLFNGAVFPPLFDSIDATIGGADHPESRGGYGESRAVPPDTAAEVGYTTHNMNGGSDHSYFNTQKLIREGYDHIVNSILAGEVTLGINNFTHPQWQFASASGDSDPVSVELNSPVTRITRICAEQRSSHPCVATEYVLERESGYSSRADVVIVAVPLGVLQKGSIELLDASSCVDWDSPSCIPQTLLSAVKRESIGSIGFGNINKLVLHYDDPCGGVPIPGGCSAAIPGLPGWDPSEDAVRVYGLARPGDYARGFLTRWFDITSVVGHPVLVGYATGLAADVMETAPTSTVMSAANETLRRIFGGYAPPVRSEITKWGSDNWEPGRYAQGAVPHWKPGSEFTMWDDVAAPIDNSMFFTGDYVVGCSNFAGYRDKDGDTCEQYDTRHYCTPMGTWGVGAEMAPYYKRAHQSYAVDGVTPFEACCACGGGIKEFGSMTSALGTTHGALMAGRNTALDVMAARDQVVMPTGGGDRPRYNCADDTTPVLFEWHWEDSRVSGSCDWFRANPWACKEGAKLFAVSPANMLPGVDIADKFEDVNGDRFSGRGPRAACPVACGTCPARACDAFPCKSDSICNDQMSHPEEITDPTDYKCDCGLSGYTGKNCDFDYRECDEEPCRDAEGLSNGICYDSVSARRSLRTRCCWLCTAGHSHHSCAPSSLLSYSPGCAAAAAHECGESCP